jgi:hypothetical protein
LVFNDSGQADKLAISLPSLFLMDSFFPNLLKTLEAVRNLNLSAKVRAQLFL